MPIWLRRLTFNLIQEHYETQNKKSEPKPKNGPPKGPDISPTYRSKASTK